MDKYKMSETTDKKVFTDVHIDKKGEWFRARACGIIIEEGCVLAVTNDAINYYYSVGGGIHIGETSKEACIREVFEETGIHYEVDRLVFIHENFFYKNNTTYHELAFYYLMKPKGNQDLNSNSYGMHGDKENLVWIPLKDYRNQTIYPVFLVDEVLNLKEGIKHIVTKEERLIEE